MNNMIFLFTKSKKTGEDEILNKIGKGNFLSISQKEYQQLWFSDINLMEELKKQKPQVMVFSDGCEYQIEEFRKVRDYLEEQSINKPRLFIGYHLGERSDNVANCRRENRRNIKTVFENNQIESIIFSRHKSVIQDALEDVFSQQKQSFEIGKAPDIKSKVDTIKMFFLDNRLLKKFLELINNVYFPEGGDVLAIVKRQEVIDNKKKLSELIPATQDRLKIDLSVLFDQVVVEDIETDYKKWFDSLVTIFKKVEKSIIQ